MHNDLHASVATYVTDLHDAVESYLKWADAYRSKCGGSVPPIQPFEPEESKLQDRMRAALFFVPSAPSVPKSEIEMMAMGMAAMKEQLEALTLEVRNLKASAPKKKSLKP